MREKGRRAPRAVTRVGSVLCLLFAVCLTAHQCGAPAIPVPRELAKVSLPPYVIEPPDILQIDALRLIPRPPYRVEPLDALAIRVSDTLPEQPIEGVYAVEPE